MAEVDGETVVLPTNNTVAAATAVMSHIEITAARRGDGLLERFIKEASF